MAIGTPAPTLSWLGIIRLGLVQTALGAIVVLTTSTLNRVMVVELALPAMLPGALVAWHYAVQMSRPRWGHGSDQGARRTPWIVGGMVVLALGGALAALATAQMAIDATSGTLLGVLAFTLIGVGVGASGTSLLALLASRTAPPRRPAAASIVWMMMIAGFVVTAITVGKLLDPFSMEKLVTLTAAVSAISVVVSILATLGIERGLKGAEEKPKEKTDFRAALADVWGDGDARLFTIFVFVSMLAYAMQDLILEPFAGLVFGFTPGQSTQLAGTQHAGVLAGMVLVAVLGNRLGRREGADNSGILRAWTVGGCLASGLALASLVIAGQWGAGWPLEASVFALGFANGAFAVAAIGSMMGLAGAGTEKREGLRMGLWGAAQAIAFGLGGFGGAALVDLNRQFITEPASAYGLVFALEALLFLWAALLAARIGRRAAARNAAPKGPLVAAE